MKVMKQKNETAKPRRRPPPPRPRTRLPSDPQDGSALGSVSEQKVIIAKRPTDELVPVPEQRLSPRQRLSAVAKGEGQLRQQDIESLLTDLVLDADQRSRSLARRCTGLVEMIFDTESQKHMDPAAALDLAVRLDRVQRRHQADARRGIELLSKISRPHRPLVQVAASQLNVAAAQQVAGPVDLGGGDDEC
jgi:hypothetical protein